MKNTPSKRVSLLAGFLLFILIIGSYVVGFIGWGSPARPSSKANCPVGQFAQNVTSTSGIITTTCSSHLNNDNFFTGTVYTTIYNGTGDFMSTGAGISIVRQANQNISISVYGNLSNNITKGVVHFAIFETTQGIDPAGCTNVSFFIPPCTGSLNVCIQTSTFATSNFANEFVNFAITTIDYPASCLFQSAANPNGAAGTTIFYTMAMAALTPGACPCPASLASLGGSTLAGGSSAISSTEISATIIY